MTVDVASGYTKARALVNACIAFVFALLMTFVTVRFALGGGWFETVLLVGLTLGMWVATIRWYRRFRGIATIRSR